MCTFHVFFPCLLETDEMVARLSRYEPPDYTEVELARSKISRTSLAITPVDRVAQRVVRRRVGAVHQRVLNKLSRGWRFGVQVNSTSWELVSPRGSIRTVSLSVIRKMLLLGLLSVQQCAATEG